SQWPCRQAEAITESAGAIQYRNFQITPQLVMLKAVVADDEIDIGRGKQVLDCPYSFRVHNYWALCQLSQHDGFITSLIHGTVSGHQHRVIFRPPSITSANNTKLPTLLS